MANLTQVAPGGVERPDVALKEDLDSVVQTANNAKAQAQETADFLETRVPIGRTINSRPLDADIVITAEDLDTYDKGTIDSKLSALEAGGYNPVKVNGHLLDRDVILSAGDIGTYSSSEIDGKVQGLVPTSRTINGRALSQNIVLTADDLEAYSKDEVNTTVSGLVAKTTKINNKELNGDITLTAADVGAADAANFVPRTYKINGTPMSGDELTISADELGGYTKEQIDLMLTDFMRADTGTGTASEPKLITSGSFATSITASGFYAYAPGTLVNDDESTTATSVSDRPPGSETGRVLALSNSATYDSETGAVSTPAVQDLLAWPNDLDGMWFKKGGSDVWVKLVTSNDLTQYLKTDASGRLDVPLIMKNNVAIRSELAAGDGGKDILKVTDTAVEVGNVDKPLHLNSSADPAVNIAGTDYKFYTEHNKPAGGFLKVTRFNASGTFTKQPETTKIIAEIIGGGGGSKQPSTSGASMAATSGGGGGAYIKFLLDMKGIDTLSCTVAARPPVGTAGAESTIVGYATAGGGAVGEVITTSNTTSINLGKASLGGSPSILSSTLQILSSARGDSGKYGSIFNAIARGGEGGASFLTVGGTGGETPNGSMNGIIPQDAGAGAGGGVGDAGAYGSSLPGTKGAIIIWEYA